MLIFFLSLLFTWLRHFAHECRVVLCSPLVFIVTSYIGTLNWLLGRVYINNNCRANNIRRRGESFLDSPKLLVLPLFNFYNTLQYIYIYIKKQNRGVQSKIWRVHLHCVLLHCIYIYPFFFFLTRPPCLDTNDPCKYYEYDDFSIAKYIHFRIILARIFIIQNILGDEYAFVCNFYVYVCIKIVFVKS